MAVCGIVSCYPGIKATPLHGFSLVFSCCPVSGLTVLRIVTVKTLSELDYCCFDTIEL